MAESEPSRVMSEKSETIARMMRNAIEEALIGFRVLFCLSVFGGLSTVIAKKRKGFASQPEREANGRTSLFIARESLLPRGFSLLFSL